MSVLRASAVSVRYGGVHALNGVDLQVASGEITGLIGPNGAGKTTFIDAVSGFTRCDGSVFLGGHDVTRLGPYARARLGLRRTWQAADLFDDLTVGENLAVAARGGSLWDLARRRKRGQGAEQTEGVVDMLGVRSLVDAYPTELTQGQRKLVGVARALAGEPRVALLDEPAAGLDTNESRELGVHLQAIARSGPAVLLVDHDMGLVLSVCHRVVVLDFGQVIAQGTPDAVKRDPAVIAAYIGSDEAGRAPEGVHEP